MAPDRDAGMSDDTRLAASDALGRLPAEEFVSRWRAIVGEPPAIMLESRSEMIRLLVDSTPPAPHRFDGPSDLFPPPYAGIECACMSFMRPEG